MDSQKLKEIETVSKGLNKTGVPFIETIEKQPKTIRLIKMNDCHPVPNPALISAQYMKYNEGENFSTLTICA